jgi:UDP-N-acetylmuramoyl-tripeptide--D-alanyl-D-alanine ligase
MRNILRFMARAVIKRRRPIIVGITGLGASLTKEAITIILSKNYFVRKMEMDGANENDIWFTIIASPDIRLSFLSLFLSFFRFLAIMLFPMRYPDVLVLDMNVGSFQDLERLMNLIPVRVGVATRISPERKEQGKLITLLPENSLAILNADDQLAVKTGEKTKAKIITYGFSEGATLLADNLVFYDGTKMEKMEKREEMRKNEGGGSFKLNYGGNTIPMRLPKITAPKHIEPILAAVAVGIALKMNLVEIVSVLEN